MTLMTCLLAFVVLLLALPTFGTDSPTLFSDTTEGPSVTPTTSAPNPTTPSNSTDGSTFPPSNEQLLYKQLSDLPDHIAFLVGATTALDQRSSDQLNDFFNLPIVSLFIGDSKSSSLTDLQKVQVLNSLKVLKVAYDLDRRIISLNKTSFFDAIFKLEFVFDRQTSKFLTSIAKVDVDSAAAMNASSPVNVSQSPLLGALNLQYRSYLFALGRVVYVGQVLQRLQSDNSLARQLPAGVMGVVRASNGGFQSTTYIANTVTDLKMTDIIKEPGSNSPIVSPQVFYYHLKRR